METPPEGAPAEPESAKASTAPLPPPELLREELAEEDDEVLRLVEEGARSPEDLRALAERLRERRALEDEVWAQKVKPGLVEARKGRLRISDLRKESPLEEDSTHRPMFLALGAAAVVALVVIIALQLPFWMIAVPVLGFLGYAFWLGLQPPPEASADGPPAADDPGGDGDAPTA